VGESLETTSNLLVELGMVLEILGPTFHHRAPAPPVRPRAYTLRAPACPARRLLEHPCALVDLFDDYLLKLTVIFRRLLLRVGVQPEGYKVLARATVRLSPS